MPTKKNNKRKTLLKDNPYFKRNDVYGFSQNYKHEERFGQTTLKRTDGVKPKRKYFVKRQGSNIKGNPRVVQVTQAQYNAYDVISDSIERNGYCSAILILNVGIKESTLKVLLKKEIFTLKDTKLYHWEHVDTDTEIMSKGGVGKLVINIGIK